MADGQLAFGQIAAPAPRIVSILLKLGDFGGQQLFLRRQLLEHRIRVRDLDFDLVALAGKQLEAALGLFAVQVALEPFLIEPRAGVLQVFRRSSNLARSRSSAANRLCSSCSRASSAARARSPSSMLVCNVVLCAFECAAVPRRARLPCGLDLLQSGARLIEIGPGIGLLRMARSRSSSLPPRTDRNSASECAPQVEVELQLLFLREPAPGPRRRICSIWRLRWRRSAGRAATSSFFSPRSSLFRETSAASPRRGPT